MTLDAKQLLGVATVAGVVAAFYYSTQRGDVQAVIREPIPFADERVGALRRRLAKALRVVILVLALHMPLTLVFLAGAVAALRTIDLAMPFNANRVAVVVVAGLAILHTGVIASDLRSVIRRLRSLPRS